MLRFIFQQIDRICLWTLLRIVATFVTCGLAAGFIQGASGTEAANLFVVGVGIVLGIAYMCRDNAAYRHRRLSKARRNSQGEAHGGTLAPYGSSRSDSSPDPFMTAYILSDSGSGSYGSCSSDYGSGGGGGSDCGGGGGGGDG